MTFLTQLFGKKTSGPAEESLTAAKELIHKVEQAFPESLKVAMRLLEKRSPEIDPLVDYGGPLHEPFMNLVLKAIHLKHPHDTPDAPPLTCADLPPLARFMDTALGGVSQLATQCLNLTEELISIKYVKEWSEWDNILLSFESHGIFADDPRTLLVYPSPEDFIVRISFFLPAIQSLNPALTIGELPDALARFARKVPGVQEDAGFLTAFGYPITRFLMAAD